MKFTVPAVLALGLVVSMEIAVDQAPTRILAGESSATKSKPAAKSMADNSVCYVCHLNYKDEPLVTAHVSDDVGCTDCHGDSWGHADDEGNATPPEKMYPLGQIDAACEECHDTHDVSARKILTRWRKRGLTRRDPTKIVCTDCHGQHRLKVRTVRWDRKTGKLIDQDKAGAKKAPDLTKKP